MTVRAHPAISTFAAKIVEWLGICHWLKKYSLEGLKITYLRKSAF